MTTDSINKNFLTQVGFKFGIKKLPTTNFFTQALNLPGREMGFPSIPTPFKSIPMAGDHIKFNDFTLTFKVDEDMENYIEIINWMEGITFPDNFEQNRLLEQKPKPTGDGVYSDGSLIIFNSSRNPIIEINFIDMFPKSITDIVFDARDTKLEYIQATAIFKFRKFTIKRL